MTFGTFDPFAAGGGVPAPPSRSHSKTIWSPESLAIWLKTHQNGEAISDARFRRRDANGCDRDGRAPERVANDWRFAPGCETKFFIYAVSARVSLLAA